MEVIELGVRFQGVGMYGLQGFKRILGAAKKPAERDIIYFGVISCFTRGPPFSRGFWASGDAMFFASILFLRVGDHAHVSHGQNSKKYSLVAR